MRKIRYIGLLLTFATLLGFATSCSDDDDNIKAQAPTVEFVKPENGYSVETGARLVPEIKVTGTEPMRYSWSVDGKETTTDRDYIFYNTTEGVYNLAVKVANEGGVAEATAQVLVVKPGTDIAVAIDRTVGTELPRYVNTTISANVHSLHNVDYLWTVVCEDSTWTSTDKDLVFNTPFTGEHKVSLRVENILGSATDEYTVTVKHAPLNVKIVCEGEEAEVESGKILKLTAEVEGDSVASYSWSVNDKVECDSAVFDFSKVDPGTYKVKLTATNRDGVAYSAETDVKVISNGFNFGLRYADMETAIGEGETMLLEGVCDWENVKFEWIVDGNVVSTDQNYTFPGSTEVGKIFNIDLTISRGDESYVFKKTIRITERYECGAFFLFEGNMTSENGALSFISDGGTVYNTVYRTNNPGLQLGNVSQGLYLHNRKIYVVSQNGSNEAYGVGNGGGIVTVIDGRTMKKIDSFPNGVFNKLIVWPREIVVPNDRCAVLNSTNYTSTNGSVCGVLDMQDKVYYEMTLPDGISYLACIIGRNGKAYGSSGKNIYEIDVENHKLGNIIATLDFDIDELLPSKDGSVWAFSDIDKTEKTIAKLTSDFRLVEQKTINIAMAQSGGMQYPRVTVGSDYIFFATSSTGNTEPVWKYEFNSNTAVPMDKKSFYNSIAYNEAKGTLYIGQVDEYDVTGTHLIQIAKYGVSGASWPAGIWFTYNFDTW